MNLMKSILFGPYLIGDQKLVCMPTLLSSYRELGSRGYNSRAEAKCGAKHRASRMHLRCTEDGETLTQWGLAQMHRSLLAVCPRDWQELAGISIERLPYTNDFRGIPKSRSHFCRQTPTNEATACECGRPQHGLGDMRQVINTNCSAAVLPMLLPYPGHLQNAPASIPASNLSR